MNSSGRAWKEHRTFLLEHMKDLGIGSAKFEVNVLEEVRPLLEVLHATQGDDFDPRYCLQTATSNIICSISFGKRFEYTDPDFVEILNIFDSNMKLAGGTAIVNYFPFLEKLPGDPFKCGQCLDNVAKIQAKLSTWVDHHKRTLDPDYPRDFIDYYLLELKKKRDRKEDTTMNGKYLDLNDSDKKFITSHSNKTKRDKEIITRFCLIFKRGLPGLRVRRSSGVLEAAGISSR